MQRLVRSDPATHGAELGMNSAEGGLELECDRALALPGG